MLIFGFDIENYIRRITFKNFILKSYMKITKKSIPGCWKFEISGAEQNFQYLKNYLSVWAVIGTELYTKVCLQYMGRRIKSEVLGV